MVLTIPLLAKSFSGANRRFTISRITSRGGKVLSRFLVGLLSPDPDEFFKDVAHLVVVDPSRRKIDIGECLNNLIKKIFFGHSGDLLTEGKSVHYIPDIGRKCGDVTRHVLGQMVGIIEKSRKIHLRNVVEIHSGGRA